MTDSGLDGQSAKAFRRGRRDWLEARVEGLAAVLETGETAGAHLHKLLPADLGEQRLVAALTIARAAAYEARAQSVAETVHWLERLIPGGHRHDLAGAVRELR